MADRHNGKKQVYSFIYRYALLSVQEMNTLISSSQMLKARFCFLFSKVFFCSIPDLICQALLEYNIPFSFFFFNSIILSITQCHVLSCDLIHKHIRSQYLWFLVYAIIYIQKTRTKPRRTFLFSHHGHEINIFSTHYVTWYHNYSIWYIKSIRVNNLYLNSY